MMPVETVPGATRHRVHGARRSSVAWKAGPGGRGVLGWVVRPLAAAVGVGRLGLSGGRRPRPGPQNEERAARLAAEGEARRFRDLIQALDAVVWEADPRTLRFTFV